MAENKLKSKYKKRDFYITRLFVKWGLIIPEICVYSRG